MKITNDLEMNNLNYSDEKSDEKTFEHFNSVEYFKSLEKWLQDVYFYQHFNTIWHNTVMFNAPSALNSSSTQTVSLRYVNNERPLRRSGVIECRLPPIWKRMAAEMIDFLCLFLLKLFATYSMLDFFEIPYDFDAMTTRVFKLDYYAALEITHNLMIIEIAHRITVCFYETYWLCRGFGMLEPGATPGKKIMHLLVVHCEKVTKVRNVDGEDIYAVEPGTFLSPQKAFIRSAVKNFVLAVFFPFTFMFMYFQNNRTGYDIISQSIVIEDPIPPYRPRGQ